MTDFEMVLQCAARGTLAKMVVSMHNHSYHEDKGRMILAIYFAGDDEGVRIAFTPLGEFEQPYHKKEFNRMLKKVMDAEINGAVRRENEKLEAYAGENE